MFEPQDHPNDFQFPGGPPIPPYDSAGWTLAYQMGVKFDRVLEGFDGPFEKISGFAKYTPGMPRPLANAAGYLLSHEVNDSFIATNRLLKDGEEVYWLKQSFSLNGKTLSGGHDLRSIESFDRRESAQHRSRTRRSLRKR